MVPTRGSQAVLLSIALLSVLVPAQTDLPNLSTITAEPGATSSADASSASSGTSSGASSSTDASSTGTATDSSASSASTTSDSSSSATASQSASSASLPTIGSSVTSLGPSFPTLAGVGVPPLIVPDTSGAPFMQKSNLPEGTVFICVGAILGFLGMCVLAWRGLVAWSLQRSVKRAASTTYASETKSMFGLGSNHGYSSVYDAKNISLEQLSSTPTSYGGPGHTHRRSGQLDGKASRSRGDRRERSSRIPTSSSLFFSPTAGAGAGTQALGDRNSALMPAGYYASGASAANGGASVAHVGGTPGSEYGRASYFGDGVSPPDSPALRPHRPTSSQDLLSGSPSGQHREQRRSRLGLDSNDASLSLAASAQGRAPSAYLEDLFENHGHGPRERF